MHVIGHEHIGVNSHAVARRRIRQAGLVEAVIVLRREHGFAIVAALDDVLGLVRDEVALETRRGLILFAGATLLEASLLPLAIRV